MRINDHYLKLAGGYLFPEIARRVAAFEESHGDTEIIRLGIGDVTEPLPRSIVAAMHEAVNALGHRETFKGYGPEQGYAWLRETVVANDYKTRGCQIDADELFISDGSKCDTGNFLDILMAGGTNRTAIADPVYPVYVDTNVMAGNTDTVDKEGRYGGLIYLPATAENQFVPALPQEAVDLIYLCYPNNPTGAVATREDLQRWVAYAREHDALILFDAAYEAYISDPEIPHSIYEIEGATEVAVEFRSFSKNAGFTGVRCAVTVVPRAVAGRDASGNRVSLHELWTRRQSTRFNGASYVVQRGAEAAYSDAGKAEIRNLVTFYMGNAERIRTCLAGLGMEVHGGLNAPYVWIQTPSGMSSWEFFDFLLQRAHVVGTPGSGFGAAGEGYLRLSAFNSRAAVDEAMGRIAESEIG